MTTHEQSRLLVSRLLEASTVPLVLDADALNVCAGSVDAVKAAKGPVLVTPHPGEMARLLDSTTADVQGDRAAAAVSAAETMGVVAVLKGAGTLVAAAGHPLQVNMTGNPGMATGGMGDVLGGVAASLLAQGLVPFDAARAAVYIHGRAGDNAAWMTSQVGLTAGDVIVELPHIFRELSGR
jgi:NAD(P)H-hydrate epimerase